MILSAHQPAYLPWLGYLDKIIGSDLFVYLDSVQFEKNSFTNRNRIKSPQGPIWLTVPVKMKGHLGRTLREIEIDNSQNWQKKHLNSIYLNYKKAPRFESIYPLIEPFFAKEYRSLSELCWEQLQFWCREFRIDTRIVRSSELELASRKSDLVLDLCRRFGADQYISGILGRDYLDEAEFRLQGIEVNYQDYQHPGYRQLWGGFEPCLSVLDFCMNCDDYDLISPRRVHR